MKDPIVQLGRMARNWAAHVDPWTNVYGLARTSLAIGTAATLTFNHSTTLFRPASGQPEVPYCGGPSGVGLFCLMPHHLEVARWLATVILVVTASGWRPRVTGLFHWWIAFSFQTSAMMLDGGDQATGVLTLIILPVALTDPRVWHWQARNAQGLTLDEVLKRLVALSALFVARLQVAGIYFHAAVGKVTVPEWADGTAVYYWFSNHSYGAPSWLLPLLMPFLTHGLTVALITWGAIVFELFLFMALVMPKRARASMFKLGVLFHASIAIIHGLISFWFAMTGALILYLRPPERPFTMPSFLRRLGEKTIPQFRRAAATR